MKLEDVASMIAHGLDPGNGGKRGWTCPDEESLAAFAESRLTGRPLERVRGHVAGCRNCLDALAFLVRLESSGEGPDVPEELLERGRRVVAPRPAPPLAWLRWGTLMATSTAAVLVAALWLGWDQPFPSPVPPAASPPAPTSPSDAVPTPRPPTMPSATAAPAAPRRNRSLGMPEKTLTQLAPAPETTLARNELEFRWSEVADALYYEVRIVTLEGDLVWQARVRTPSARPPDDVTLAPGRRYFAWVRAALRDGRTIASPARAFTIQGG